MKRNDVALLLKLSPLRGDAGCYFAVTYNPNDSGEIINDRHILSENDFFATYGLASEVLGE